MSFYLKDPGSRIDYLIDWAPYLDGQEIEASIWAVAPVEAGGIAVEESSFEAGRAASRLSGGVIGHSYTISNRVTLSDGSVDERSLALRVEQR